MNLFRSIALSLALISTPALAQWQTPNHSVPIGHGVGISGFGNAKPGAIDIPFLSNGAAADPSFRVLPNAGLANMGASTIKCNPLALAGTPQDCTSTQVQTLIGGTSGGFEASTFNAGGSSKTTTGTIAAASTILTLPALSDFINGEGIRVNHAGAAFIPGPPTSLIVTPTGTPGAVTYTYTIAAIDAIGGVGPAIASVTTTTGNATLSSTNFNALTWTPPGPAPFGYAVYASCPACTAHTTVMTLVAIRQNPAYNDVGFNLIVAAPDWLPLAPQAVSLSSWLVTSVVSGSGSATLTLAAPAVTAATIQLVDHDDTVALQACITAAVVAHTRCHLSGLSGEAFPTSSTLTANGRFELFGSGIQGTQNYNYGNQGSRWLDRSTLSNATAILPPVTQTGLLVTTNDAVNIHDFAIAYTANPAQIGGVTGLQIAGTGGAYTVVQTGTLNGTTTVTGLTDTRYMHVGQGLFGTNISAGTTVALIDSPTQIHISSAALGSGASSLTFDVITGDTLSATITSGSNVLTGMTNANFIQAGEVVTCPNCASDSACFVLGTVVTASTSTTVTLNNPAVCTGTTPLTFTFGISTNASVHGMLLAGADRNLFLGNMTEFWVWNNKLYDALSFSTIFDLNNGNGDWQYSGNIHIAGSIFPLVHMWHLSGGGGRVFGNKLNTGGSVNVNGAGGTVGMDFNALRDFTSFEPPTITGNSIEGLGIGIRAFNSCPHPTTCQGSQFSITGNQFWNNRDIEFDALFSFGTIVGNSVAVNGGAGAKNFVFSGVSNIVWSGNNFANTTGLGSAAIDVSGGCTNCSGSGNKKQGNTTLGASALTAIACGVANTHANPNSIQFNAAGGTGVTAISKNGSTMLSQASAALPNTPIYLDPGDTFTVTCATPPVAGTVYPVNP